MPLSIKKLFLSSLLIIFSGSVIHAGLNITNIKKERELGSIPVFTGADISSHQYVVLKSNIEAKAISVLLAGFFPITVNGKNRAISRILKIADLEGKKNVALINVVVNREYYYGAVVGILKTTVRADLIQFEEKQNK